MIGLSYFRDEVIRGDVTFTNVAKNQVRVSINLVSNILINSTHGIHVHEKPITPELAKSLNCCDSLGGHFNPTGKHHGHSSKGHVGDLCNNIEFKNGICNYSYIDNAISLDTSSRLCIIGRSLIIHSGVDDCGQYKIYPVGSDEARDSRITGNAGSRISCANIVGYY
jgi:Cu-Zn family superoxide dismutase